MTLVPINIFAIFCAKAFNNYSQHRFILQLFLSAMAVYWVAATSSSWWRTLLPNVGSSRIDFGYLCAVLCACWLCVEMVWLVGWVWPHGFKLKLDKRSILKWVAWVCQGLSLCLLADECADMDEPNMISRIAATFVVAAVWRTIAVDPLWSKTSVHCRVTGAGEEGTVGCNCKIRSSNAVRFSDKKETEFGPNGNATTGLTRHGLPRRNPSLARETVDCGRVTVRRFDASVLLGIGRCIGGPRTHVLGKIGTERINIIQHGNVLLIAAVPATTIHRVA